MRNKGGIEVVFISAEFYTNNLDRAGNQFIPAAGDVRIGPPDVLTEENLGAADFFDFQTNHQLVVEARRLQVFNVDRAHDKGDARVT